MYAVVRTGGKQYRVSVGDIVDVEKVHGAVGDQVVLSDVLFVSDDEGTARVGTPSLPDVTVACTIREQNRNDKVIVFKKKRRKGYHRKLGHRQAYTRLVVNAIHV
jgi:large subunit ribosomal protein L21